MNYSIKISFARYVFVILLWRAPITDKIYMGSLYFNEFVFVSQQILLVSLNIVRNKIDAFFTP